MTMAVDWGEEEEQGFDRGLARRALGYLRPHRRLVLFALAGIAAAAALGLVPALVFKELIDYLADPDDGFGRVAAIVAVGVGAAILAGALSLAESYLAERISQGIMFDLREQLFGSLLRQSVGFYTDRRAGEVMSRMTNDITAIQDAVAETVFGVARNAVIALSTLVFMVVLDWRLTLLALVLIVVMGLPMARVGQRVYRASAATQSKVSEMTGYLHDVLGISGALLVKAFTRERAEGARFRALNDEVRRLHVRQAMISERFAASMDVLATAAPALIILFGGYLVIEGQASVGTVFVFATVLMSRLGASVGSLGQTQVNLMGALAVFRRLFTYIDHPPEVAERTAARSLDAARGDVRLDDVTFTYPTAARPALANISLTVEPGELVAIVGPSGAGKTTLTTLVPRFCDPQHGRVSIDGQDVRELTLESLRAAIGIVFQDTFLFHASLRDNLLYARPDASEAELVAAARAAHLLEVVGSLPDGYDTIVGERGHRLSGGEKQRVALARVILKDPRILILDEATSNLDSVSEQLIQAALAPLFAGRTSLVIAHRLSTILAADTIVVLDRGRLVEQGEHADLLERGGLYATLYERQFRTQPAGPACAAAETIA